MANALVAHKSTNFFIFSQPLAWRCERALPQKCYSSTLAGGFRRFSRSGGKDPPCENIVVSDSPARIALVPRIAEPWSATKPVGQLTHKQRLKTHRRCLWATEIARRAALPYAAAMYPDPIQASRR
jgi:hypothetical protein